MLKAMRTVVRRGWIAAALAVLYLGWTFAGRWLGNRRYEVRMSRPAVAQTGSVESGDTRILHFYAYPGELIEGDSASLCYGVENARSATIDPGFPDVKPTMNRCMPIAPGENTRYTLTAVGRDGRTVTASFELAVKPDPAVQPKIVYFRDCGKQQRVRNAVGDVSGSGRSLHLLCFFTQNALEISIDPPVFSPFRGVDGRFYVTPGATTTYTLTATGRKGRKAERQLTLRVE